MHKVGSRRRTDSREKNTQKLRQSVPIKALRPRSVLKFSSSFCDTHKFSQKRNTVDSRYLEVHIRECNLLMLSYFNP